MKSPRASLLLALLLGLAVPAAPRADQGNDHDRARRAVEAGEILSLRDILERVERDMPGQVMEVELEQEDGRWIYEIKLLRRGGALVKLEIDARDGTVLKSKERGSGGRR